MEEETLSRTGWRSGGGVHLGGRIFICNYFGGEVRFWYSSLSWKTRHPPPPPRDVILIQSLEANYHNDDFKRPIGLMITLFSTFLWRPLTVHCTTTTWNLLIWRFMENVDIRHDTTTNFPSSFWTRLNNILKNSTPGKVACIWLIERVQIDAIKFERTQIHFFYRRFHCKVSTTALHYTLLYDLIYLWEM